LVVAEKVVKLFPTKPQILVIKDSTAEIHLFKFPAQQQLQLVEVEVDLSMSGTTEEVVDRVVVVQ